MRAIALKIVVLWGWRRALVAALAGAASALAMAPFELFPVLFVTLPALVWMLDGASGEDHRPAAAFRQAAAIGWFFGFGFFLAGLHWVGEAFFVEARIFAWMVPFVLVLFPAGLALFPAAACAGAMLLWAPGFARILALAGTWTACEWLRGHLFTGFPWNGLGYAFAGSDILAQSASLWGVYGLGFAVVLITAAPATLADDYPLARQTTTRRWVGPAVMFATVSALAAYGYVRLADAQLVAVDGVRVRIVQPNIPQAEKWLPDNQNRIFARFLELSNQATSPETMGIDDVTHLIWPESALPFLLASRSDALAAIAALLPDGTQLVTGALRRGDASAPTGRPQVFNSILVIDSQGQVIATYDKEHLVPFGEYLPFESVFAPLGLRKLVTLPLGFEAGPGRKTIADATGPRFSPLICYEVIFPGAVADAAERPGWLLNVTNDAWFGSSIGPHQHFQQARMRAIEEGLPLARAANTGISAVVDPYGRILKSLALGTAGVLDSRLPVALPPTLYVHFRDLPVLVLVLIALACALSARVAVARADNAVTRRNG